PLYDGRRRRLPGRALVFCNGFNRLIRLRINPCAQVRRPFGSAIADDLADCLQRTREALMKVTVRREGDLERLDELIAREKVAVQRDRLRAVRLALDGVESLQIAATLS